ncbi:hypothetical protein GOODEAATRI_023781 [Goodea atripinnis]|uniref:Uncharacterized protein n=1 Tax=Goodea atripinnis TaxID=208336 RepID=A0ABV0MLC0_9TELE
MGNVGINPKTKAEDPWKVLLKLVRVEVLFYQPGLKGHSVKKKPLLQQEHKKPGYSLQIHQETNTCVMLGNMSCSLRKYNVGVSFCIMIVVRFILASLRTSS